jgi:hypothetical protein
MGYADMNASAQTALVTGATTISDIARARNAPA